LMFFYIRIHRYVRNLSFSWKQNARELNFLHDCVFCAHLHPLRMLL
jgi:hypothetical protein